MRLRSFCLSGALVLAACAPSAADAPIAEQWRSVEVTVAPIDFGTEHVGRLRFRGGVEIRSDDPVFGGISGIEVLDGTRVIAVSDNGDWFEWRLVLDEEGVLTGVGAVRTAFMRNEDGEPFPSKASGDAEDVAQLPDGRFAVSFEQTQSIRIYDLNRDGAFGAAAPGPVLDGVARLPGNNGLEALAASEDGALIVGAEGGGEATTPLWRARLDAPAPARANARYPLSGGFSLTALDRLPDGGYVALERFYAPVIGARARITRVASLGEGEVEAEELALIESPRPVDNFEAIAAVSTPDGAVRVYIVSDDNFNRRQRTLLLAFDILN
mgnify:CR=1 FL=1